MQTIWKRIEVWFESHTPELLPLLQPGASEEDIQRTEALLHVTFPEDIKESYGLHNGSGHVLVKGHALLSLDQMVEIWDFTVPPYEEEQDRSSPTEDDSEFWQEEEDDWRMAIPPGVFLPEGGYDRQLIPLLRWTDEGILCFDADPHDTCGVIFQYFAQGGGLSFYAWSWRELLSQFADDLEAGKYDIERGNSSCFLQFNDPTQPPI